MLAELSIRNFAIIEQLRLQFGPGFSVLTGETGTGKSIIIDAVSLLLGERASTDLIRTGSDSATIEAVFTLSPDLAASLNPILEEQGLADGNELILRREISRNRRSICRVNGHAVTLTAFQEIGHHLIDIHGQGEHLSLMQVRRHVDFLDRYAGLVSPRQEFAAQVERLRRVRRELANLRRDERELARRVDLLTYQIQEIEAAALQPGEEDELRRQRTLLANAEKRMQLSARIYALLSQGEEEQRSAADLLSDASESLTDLARLDDALAEESRQLEGLLDQLEDLARTMRNYRDEIEYDPRGLEEVEERIELIHELERKYGDSIEDVLEFARRAQEELDNISHSEERLEELMAEEAALLRGIAARGQALSAARREAAGRLSRDIEEQLADLNMENARFMVDMR
ncbi:MAG: DNA repair protein RecN, partial [Anaerolineae bacterium]